jgi:hypothetical protein
MIDEDSAHCRLGCSRGKVYNPVFRFVSRFILGHTQAMDAYLKALGKAVGEEVELRN